MNEYSFVVLGFSDLALSGPDPFQSNGSPSNAAINNNSQITLAPGATYGTLFMTDNDPNLEHKDSGQKLSQPLTLNGESYGVGQGVEVKYSYVIRPVGSTDPADDITIYVLRFGKSVQGIAVSSLLRPGVTYEITSGTKNPSVAYANLVLCFTPGAAIATPRGPVAVERLRVGDLVSTVDNGPQPLVWIGTQLAAGTGAGAPVSVAPGVLGNRRRLVLSQQHRVLMPRGLCPGPAAITPVKALVGLPGVAYAPQRHVTYIHLMLERHELILAEGAPAETFLPGPMALRTLSRRDLAEVLSLFPAVDARPWAAVRPILPPGHLRRLLAKAGQPVARAGLGLERVG